ncbi:type VI immunity family protein [Pyxidicoccus caerfyrddinensis]|uniref:type VI immunity family protein n=1 Tax=Pyxidicoccus caerfyrddinensis TaxID=2709663 RepID=UPI001F07775D|nr:type VI immunity family protein [Pyxidicoccus caerfyrddinensis]
MNKPPPRIRLRKPNGVPIARDALCINLYMRHPRREVAPALLRSIDRYRRVLGNDVLSRYSSEGYEWDDLDDAAWEHLRGEVLDGMSAIIKLKDITSGENRFRLDYYGSYGALIGPPTDEPTTVCAVSFWLPTEYLEEHGPGHVRELALELAAPLPFCSGHAGLAFNTDYDLLYARPELRKWLFLHPGMDAPRLGRLALHLGAKVRTPSWLTFLGQPVLGELGGASGLRSRLQSPDITVQEMEGERVVVTVGPEPEAGEDGRMPPAYRELARVLEPWLFHEKYLIDSTLTADGLRRWERRLLD